MNLNHLSIFITAHLLARNASTTTSTTVTGKCNTFYRFFSYTKMILSPLVFLESKTMNDTLLTSISEEATHSLTNDSGTITGLIIGSVVALLLVVALVTKSFYASVNHKS
jgi:hypothetical protein